MISEYNIGAVKLCTETAFLSELDSDGIMECLKDKVEELMPFIILPLSYRKKGIKGKENPGNSR